jgi:hypothetical protein
MSWIDDELNTERELERQSREKASSDNERELHRAQLITSKGREIWDTLKAECRAQANEFESKCGSGPECKVSFQEDQNNPDHFQVRREMVRSTEAYVNLHLRGYEIEINHNTPGEGSSKKAVSYLTFDCDGLNVLLKSEGKELSVPAAAKKVLKPVLFPVRGL